MTRRACAIVALLVVAAASLLFVVGCASTRAVDTGSDNPDLIRNEISEINNDIRNTEEMYKASLTELQMEENMELRREVNRLWVELEHLRSRKTALENRLAELEAGER
jgi:uncharacterized protein YhaN